MATEPLKYDINGWTFQLDRDTTKPVSWVYKNVRNDDYNFASQISIEKIIVGIEEQTENGFATREISLKYEHLVPITPDEELELLQQSDETRRRLFDAANFSVYQGQGVLVARKTKEGTLPTKVEKGEEIESPLFLFITFTFSEYANEPPHEFTGLLSAARFSPVVRFETTNESVKAIRVHYRFHFDLDSYLREDDWFFGPEEQTPPPDPVIKRENYASVIRDADQFPPSLTAVVEFAKELREYPRDLASLSSTLEEFNIEGSCRDEARRLGLDITDSFGRPYLPQAIPAENQLNISFWDPHPRFTTAGAEQIKVTELLSDDRVKALNISSYFDYKPAVIDELTPLVKSIIGGGTKATGVSVELDHMPYVNVNMVHDGITDECLTNNIKQLLVMIAISNYRRNKRSAIKKQIRVLRDNLEKDSSDILRYIEPEDIQNLYADLDELMDYIEEISLPLLFAIMNPLTALDRLKRLIGKLISIGSFDAAEKPILYEVAGRYVDQGMAGQRPDTGKRVNTWDNLHWWGTKDIPSAPGAFHAIHSHYRWTQLNAYPTATAAAMQETANEYFGSGKKLRLGEGQFRSMVKEFADLQLSGPLIDPNLPNQTISFAIAENGSALDEMLKLSDKPIDEKLESPIKPIAKVNKSGNVGADIVYWLSCEAVRTKADSFKGALLINGFYFAHDEEKPFSFFGPSNMFDTTRGIDLQKPKRKEPYELFRGPFDES